MQVFPSLAKFRSDGVEFSIHSSAVAKVFLFFARKGSFSSPFFTACANLEVIPINQCKIVVASSLFGWAGWAATSRLGMTGAKAGCSSTPQLLELKLAKLDTIELKSFLEKK